MTNGRRLPRRARPAPSTTTIAAPPATLLAATLAATLAIALPAPLHAQRAAPIEFVPRVGILVAPISEPMATGPGVMPTTGARGSEPARWFIGMAAATPEWPRPWLGAEVSAAYAPSIETPLAHCRQGPGDLVLLDEEPCRLAIAPGRLSLLVVGLDLRAAPWGTEGAAPRIVAGLGAKRLVTTGPRGADSEATTRATLHLGASFPLLGDPAGPHLEVGDYVSRPRWTGSGSDGRPRPGDDPGGATTAAAAGLRHDLYLRLAIPLGGGGGANGADAGGAAPGRTPAAGEDPARSPRPAAPGGNARLEAGVGFLAPGGPAELIFEETRDAWERPGALPALMTRLELPWPSERLRAGGSLSMTTGSGTTSLCPGSRNRSSWTCGWSDYDSGSVRYAAVFADVRHYPDIGGALAPHWSVGLGLRHERHSFEQRWRSNDDADHRSVSTRPALLLGAGARLPFVGGTPRLGVAAQLSRFPAREEILLQPPEMPQSPVPVPAEPGGLGFDAHVTLSFPLDL